MKDIYYLAKKADIMGGLNIAHASQEVNTSSVDELYQEWLVRTDKSFSDFLIERGCMIINPIDKI